MGEWEYLEKLTGHKWTGVRFSRAAHEKIHPFALLCEAVDQSFEKDFVLECAELCCSGALYSLGLDNDESRMVHRMSGRAGLSPEHTRRIIRETPQLGAGAVSVELGRIDHPDILVSYLTPEAAMWLLRRWQQSSGNRLAASLSAFTALCAAVVEAYNRDMPVFSFGCPDSRAYGGIAEEKLIAAIPFDLATKLWEEDGQHANL